MKSNGGRFSLKTLLLALAMFMAMPLFAVSAQAQDGWWGNRNQDQRERRRERRENRRERRRDRREDRRDDRNRNDGYYDNDGYYGNNNRNDGYYGNNGFDAGRQTALNAGFNNGIEEGRKDRQRNERFDYRDESDYQKATEDYSSKFGDRARYQAFFRQGFANGYRSGYNGY